MEGIHFEDCENNHKVRVDVFAQFQTGELQLHPTHFSLADFSCESQSWSCHYDGANKSLTFLASPMNVTVILSNLTFVPFVALKQHGDDDAVVVRVYSEQGGNCWTSPDYGEAILVCKIKRPRMYLLLLAAGCFYLTPPRLLRLLNKKHVMPVWWWWERCSLVVMWLLMAWWCVAAAAAAGLEELTGGESGATKPWSRLLVCIWRSALFVVSREGVSSLGISE